MTTKTAHRQANGTPPVAEQAVQQSPAEELQVWLEQRGLTLQVRVKTPMGGETVDPRNFIPAGWEFVFQLNKEK